MFLLATHSNGMQIISIIKSTHAEFIVRHVTVIKKNMLKYFYFSFLIRFIQQSWQSSASYDNSFQLVADPRIRTAWTGSGYGYESLATGTELATLFVFLMLMIIVRTKKFFNFHINV
jgi:hypothetical protein